MTFEQFNFSQMVIDFKNGIFANYPNLDFFIAGIICGWLIGLITFLVYDRLLRKKCIVTSATPIVTSATPILESK